MPSAAHHPGAMPWRTLFKQSTLPRESIEPRTIAFHSE